MSKVQRLRHKHCYPEEPTYIYIYNNVYTSSKKLFCSGKDIHKSRVNSLLCQNNFPTTILPFLKNALILDKKQ